MRRLFLVFAQHQGGWDWSKDMRGQERWDEHARFMDDLVDTGVVVLGGPLDEREVVLAVAAESEAWIRARLAADPWIEMGILGISAIRPWTVLLDGTRPDA